MYIRSTNVDKKIINKLSKNSINKKSELNNLNFIKNKIIKKPWGFEYCFWSSKKAAFWVLHINKKQSTSLHCHIFKKTFLINLNNINLKTLKENYKLNSHSIIEIDKKTFHQTKNKSNKNLIMFELEIPNRKFDLLRFKDKYNRKPTSYEKNTLKDKISINLKKNINSNYLEIYDGKKNKSNKSLKKNTIIILVNGNLKIKNNKMKLFRPYKTNINLTLKHGENFSNLTKFIMIKKKS